MDYSNLSEKDKEIVERWLQRKCMSDYCTYTTYEEMCLQYLGDEKKDHYVIRTRNSLTASKLKCFIKNPEEYHIKYNLELPELQPKDKRCFVIWSAFDCLLSYGMEKFYEKYYIDDGLVVEELKEKLIQRGENPAEVKAMKLPELRAIYYKDWERIRLTPAEWRDIIGMYYEVKRQPKLETNVPYDTQKRFECKYKSLTISWTLDRHIEWIIRDRKTSGNIDNIERDIENTFDYVTQMSFYYILAYIETGIECDVYLDIVSNKAPYTSISYRLTKEKLRRKMNNDLKPAMDSLINCYETNERPVVDRYIAMKSSYYSIMQSSIASEVIDSN